jgi:hypothetical protein
MKNHPLHCQNVATPLYEARRVFTCLRKERLCSARYAGEFFIQNGDILTLLRTTFPCLEQSG